MSRSDDLVSALQEAVRREVLENYFHERRVLEEECAMVREDVSAFHGGEANLRRRCNQLALLLFEPRAVAEFFAMTGLRPCPDYSTKQLRATMPLKSIGGWTRCGRYESLVRLVYTDLWHQASDLAEEFKRLKALVAEVNGDIKRFEANHDMLGIMAYMRSLDPAELQRRKIMGVNFGYGETSAAAANLSFKPFSLERLELLEEPPAAEPPAMVMRRAGALLRRVCRANKAGVDQVLELRRKALEAL